jgi:hypothetical protein
MQYVSCIAEKGDGISEYDLINVAALRKANFPNILPFQQYASRVMPNLMVTLLCDHLDETEPAEAKAGIRI